MNKVDEFALCMLIMGVALVLPYVILWLLRY
jgi:hypothetical protein